MSGPRYAAIDLGTNTALLTIAERRDSVWVPLLERSTITRLGEGTQSTGSLSEAACARTLACLDSYAKDLRLHRVTELHVVGTSALREAKNGSIFCAEAERSLGVPVEIISGQREASLTFLGATLGRRSSEPVLVFDIGGGSTEFAWARPSESGFILEHTASLKLGSVRLFEQHPMSDPPLVGELLALRQSIAHSLRAAGSPPFRAGLVIAVAGTAMTMAERAREWLPEFQSDGESELPADLSPREIESTFAALQKAFDSWSTMCLADRMRDASLEEGRADLILAGGALLLEILNWVGTDRVIASSRGVRWGVLEELCPRGNLGLT